MIIFIKQAMNQIYKITAIAVMAAFLVQCSPKATAPLVESPNVTETPPPTRNHPILCKSFSDLSGNDRDKAETAFVLYKDQMKYKITRQHCPFGDKPLHHGTWIQW